MQESTGERPQPLIKRTAATVVDPRATYAERSVAAAKLTAIPVTAVAGTSVLSAVDPTLVHGVVSHLGFGAAALTPAAGVIGIGVGLGIAVREDAARGREHPYARPIHAHLRATRIGATAVAGISLGGGAGIEIVDAVTQAHTALGTADNLFNLGATAGLLAVTAGGLGRLWAKGIVANRTPPGDRGVAE